MGGLDPVSFAGVGPLLLAAVALVMWPWLFLVCKATLGGLEYAL